MWDIFKRVPKKEKFTFEYRVLARKNGLGNTYYTAESTDIAGKVVGLYNVPYAVPGSDATRGTVATYYARREPDYVFSSDNTAMMMNYSLATFTDPIKAKETVCRIRKDERDRAKYRAYKTIISVGACKC